MFVPWSTDVLKMIIYLINVYVDFFYVHIIQDPETPARLLPVFCYELDLRTRT